MLNWNDYRYLLAVEAAGSLAAAARRLQVSQPTVGRRLTALSEELGVPLVVVSVDGTRLSEQGRRVCQQARILEQQAALIEISARESQSSEAKRIRLAALEPFAHVLLVRLLAEFQLANPLIHFDLISGTRISDVRHSEADVALRVGDPMDDQLLGRIVGKVEYGLYVHESYLERSGPIETVDDLNRCAIIESTGDIANMPQARRLRELAPQARVGLSSNSQFNQIDAMVNGFGLLPLSNYRAQGVPGIRRILKQDFVLQSDIWLLYRADVRERPEVRALIEYLARVLPKEIRTHSAQA
ncbi:MAG: LysR family transcriptional regulator [Pseudomonadota bacterium]